MNYSVILNGSIVVAFLIAGYWALGIYTRWVCESARNIALRNLRHDLGTLKWIGADEGWELAIEAVRKEIGRRVDSTQQGSEKAR